MIPDANVSTLELSNDSLTPGFSTPQQDAFTGAVAYDPQLDRLFVTGRASSLPFSAISIIDPATASVAGAINDTACLNAFEYNALLFDPNDGLLYTPCFDHGLDGFDPATGALVSHVALDGISAGPDCAGYTPIAVAIAAAYPLHDLFVAVVGCDNSSAGPPTSPLTLNIVDDRTNTVALNVTLPVTTSGYGFEQMLGTECIAFDNQSGEVYLDTGLTVGGAVVDIVDPLTGHLAGSVVVDAYPATGSVLPSAYVSALSSVVAAGVHPGSGNGTGLFRVDLKSGVGVPILTWFGTTPTGGLSRAPAVRPGWLTAGPGSGENLTVSAALPGIGTRTLIYNLTSKVEVDNLSTDFLGPSAYDAADQVLYAVDAAGDAVVGLGGVPTHVVSEIALGVAAYAAAIDPSTETLYLAAGSVCGTPVEYGGGIGSCPYERVDTIPMSTERVAGSWSLPAGLAQAVAFDPANQELYSSMVCGVWNGSAPCGPHNATALVESFRSTGVPVAQGAIGLPPGPGGIDEEGVAFDSAAGDLLISNEAAHGDMLLAVNATTLGVVGSFSLGHSSSGPATVEYDAHDNLVLVGYRCFTSLAPLRESVCLDSYNGSTYALQASTALPGSETLGFFGNGPIAYDPLNDTVFASNGSAVFTIRAATDTIAGSFSAFGADALQFDSANGALYTLGFVLTEINATSDHVLSAYLVSAPYTSPTGFVVDPVSGTAVVWNFGDGTVLFVPGPGPARYDVGFVRSGLPDSTPWTVSLDGQNETGVGPLSFVVPNGTYSYRIDAIDGYRATGLPYAGNITVLGSNVTEPTVVFRASVYPITFSELGAPSASGWTVALDQLSGTPYAGPCTGCLNSSTQRSFLGTNGTYHYLLESLGRHLRIVGVPPTGEINITGAPIGLTFELESGSTPALAFHERGLPSGTKWCVSLFAVSRTCSTTTSIRWGNLTPAVYAYRVSPVAGYNVSRASGIVHITPMGGSVGVKFSPAKYLVSVVESGLRNGTRWGAEIDGKSLSGKHRLVTLDLPNGTYGYATARVPGYVGSSAGTIVVNGTGASVDVQFNAVLYILTFTESGLPPGSNWSVTLGTTTVYSTNATLRFHEPNGTYYFRVASVGGYRPSPGHQSVRVDGAPASVAVSYRSSGAVPLRSSPAALPAVGPVGDPARRAAVA